MRLDWMKEAALLAIGFLALQTGLTAGVAPPARAADTISADSAPALKTQNDKESYSIGVETGRNLRREGIEADPDLVSRGVKDALTGGRLLLPDREIQDTLNIYATHRRVNKSKERLISGQENQKEGEEFLSANRAKDGVVTLPTGLQYKILKGGDGRKPAEADMVECYFRGVLINGTEFDSAARPGQPATFKLDDRNLIPGMREALKLMPVGSIWQLFVPPQLAYGQRGSGRGIGPNATLIFEVELLAIK